MSHEATVTLTARRQQCLKRRWEVFSGESALCWVRPTNSCSITPGNRLPNCLRIAPAVARIAAAARIVASSNGPPSSTGQPIQRLTFGPQAALTSVGPNLSEWSYSNVSNSGISRRDRHSGVLYLEHATQGRAGTAEAFAATIDAVAETK